MIIWRNFDQFGVNSLRQFSTEVFFFFFFYFVKTWKRGGVLYFADQVAGEGIIAVLELAVIYQFCYLITRKRAYILAAIQVTSQRIAIEDIDDYHKQLMLARQIFWAEDPDTATAILKAVTDPVYPRRIPLAKHARRSWISGDVHKYIRPTDTPRSIVSAYFRLEGDIPLTELKIGVCPGSLLDHAGVLALLITSQKYYKVFIQALKAQEVLASELPDAAARLVAKHLVDEKMFSKLVVKFTDSLKTNVVTWGRILPFLPISVPSGFSCDENSPSFARNETARRDLMVPFILSTLDYEAAHASHTPFGQKIQSQINEICLIGKEVHDRRKQAGRQGANP